MKTEEINSGDTIDVRDVIARVEKLQESHDALTEDMESNPNDQEKHDALTDWEDDYAEELKRLTALLEELAGNGGDEQWQGVWYPITLIQDSYFVEAMQELVQDIGDLPKSIPSYLVIDWDATAKNLQQDYSSVEFNGDTYWYR